MLVAGSCAPQGAERSRSEFGRQSNLDFPQVGVEGGGAVQCKYLNPSVASPEPQRSGITI